jgi:hypothetical protein
MTLQDLRTYSETDPDGVMEVSGDGTRVTLANADRDNDAHLDSNKGAGALGDGDYTFEIEVQSADPRSFSAHNILSDTNGNWGDLTASEPVMGMYVSRSSGGAYIIGIQQWNPYLEDVFSGYSLSTPYYVTVNRSGATVTVDIYDDPAKLIPVDTLVLSGALATAFQCHIASSTGYNAGLHDKEIDVWAQNFDLPISSDLPTGKLTLTALATDLALDRIPGLEIVDITPGLEVIRL